MSLGSSFNTLANKERCKSGVIDDSHKREIRFAAGGWKTWGGEWGSSVAFKTRVNEMFNDWNDWKIKVTRAASNPLDFLFFFFGCDETQSCICLLINWLIRWPRLTFGFVVAIITGCFLIQWIILFRLYHSLNNLIPAEFHVYHLHHLHHFGWQLSIVNILASMAHKFR